MNYLDPKTRAANAKAPKRRGRVSPISRIPKSYGIALGVVLLATLWVASGQFSGPIEPGQVATSQGQALETGQVGGPAMAARSEPLVQARVSHLVAAPIVSQVIVQGETKPNRAVEVKAQVRGTITEVTKQKGAAIVANEALFSIADEGRTEQLDKAKAAMALRQAEFQAAQSLTETGFNTRIRLAEARSNLASAQAELVARQLDADHLVIRAPFDGVLDEREVEAGDVVEQGRSVGRIVELNPIKVIGQVSESNINDVRVGMTAQIDLVDGRRFPARLTFKSSTADTETRTFEVELEAPNPEGAIIGGLTATIGLPTGEKLGHLVSPSVLTLSDSGQIGVKIVDVESRIRFVPVTILDEGPDGTWIGGLPREVDLVTVGQDFVAENELVEPVFIDFEG